MLTTRVTALCRMCNHAHDTTFEALRISNKCPNCGHGNLGIILGEYTELANQIFQVAQALKNLPQADLDILAEPITELLKTSKPGRKR